MQQQSITYLNGLEEDQSYSGEVVEATHELASLSSDTPWNSTDLLKTELFHNLQRNASARSSRPGEAEGDLPPSLQPTLSAHTICGRGGLVTSTGLCTVESKPRRAAIPCCSPTAEGQSLEEKSSLSAWESRLLGCIAWGRLQWVIFFIVLNFSILYLLLLVLCFLQTCLTRLALHITKAFEVQLLICVLSAKQRWSCPSPKKAFKSNKAISSSGQGLSLVMQIFMYVVWAMN